MVSRHVGFFLSQFFLVFCCLLGWASLASGIWLLVRVTHSPPPSQAHTYVNKCLACFWVAFFTDICFCFCFCFPSALLAAVKHTLFRQRAAGHMGCYSFNRHNKNAASQVSARVELTLLITRAHVVCEEHLLLSMPRFGLCLTPLAHANYKFVSMLKAARVTEANFTINWFQIDVCLNSTYIMLTLTYSHEFPAFGGD